jgi:hypothetical protein
MYFNKMTPKRTQAHGEELVNVLGLRRGPPWSPHWEIHCCAESRELEDAPKNQKSENQGQDRTMFRTTYYSFSKV